MSHQKAAAFLLFLLMYQVIKTRSISNSNFVYMLISQLRVDIASPDSIVVHREEKTADKGFVIMQLDFPPVPVFGNWSVKVYYGHNVRIELTIFFSLPCWALPPWANGMVHVRIPWHMWWALQKWVTRGTIDLLGFIHGWKDHTTCFTLTYLTHFCDVWFKSYDLLKIRLCHNLKITHSGETACLRKNINYWCLGDKQKVHVLFTFIDQKQRFFSLMWKKWP